MAPTRPSLPNRRAGRPSRPSSGPGHVLVDPDLVGHHEVDWTGRFRGATPAVDAARATPPRSPTCSRVCDGERIAVVPQGGNTGLVGGGVPLHGEIVLSLRRLDALGPGRRRGRPGRLPAPGSPSRPCSTTCAVHGLAYGVDLAARGSATVGGTVATNAGGVHVLRWGATRRQVVGIEAVTADGRVLRHLDGLVKDNTGYDLAGLLCGSEGTLAVVTAARLALVPRYTDARVVALCAFADVATAVAVTAAVRRRVEQLDAAELFLADGLDLVCEVTGRPAPVRRRLSGARAVRGLRARRTRPTPSPPRLATRAGCSTSPSPPMHRASSELWAYREEHTAAINSLGPPHKLDVTLPLGAAGRVHGSGADRGGGGRRPTPGAGCSATSATATCTSTSPGSDPDDETVDDAVLADWWWRPAARSAPSTASARRSGGGSRCSAAPRSWPCSGRSRRRSTRTGS